MGEIFIAGQRFYVDAPVINMHEGLRWDATSPFCIPSGRGAAPVCREGKFPYSPKAMNRSERRFMFRPALRRLGHGVTLQAAQAVIRKFILHHDGCASAAMCWDVLHNERGLSCHFLIDNDGTIYQTLDLALCGFHAAEFNPDSIGVEFCNRGDAAKEPWFYEKKGQARETKTCRINGHAYKAFDFTKPQIANFKRLARALTKLLPNLPVEYPQIAPGQQAWETLVNASSFAGYIGHYHLTARKWDPGPFDFKDFCRSLRGEFCFPMFTRDLAQKKATDRPTIPDRSDLLAKMAQEMTDANELRADGGFFPVGPWGEARLWHGGVHIPGERGQPLFAPFPGRIVAARMGATSPVGSPNFVLLRHDLSLGATPVRFYSLFMHLADEFAEATPLEWVQKAGLATAAKPGEVALIGEPVDAGAIIGRIGLAGPGDLAKPQYHFEIFSPNELFTDVEGTRWQVIDGTAGGRFCDVDEVNRIIDTDRDGKLAREELTRFYAGTGDEDLRYAVTFHYSEWAAEPSWAEALKNATDFRDIDAETIDTLVAEQLTPLLWWTREVAEHCKLPTEAVVYHYHPVTFLRWFNEKLIEYSVVPPVIADTETSAAPDGITDDFGDEAGEHALSADLSESDPCDESLTLEQLVRGYESPECVP